MQLTEKGSGPALVVIPGFQGRWEYHRPAVDALARSFRVITFALCGERASGLPFDRSAGLGNFVAQVRGALDARRIDRAIICGVSFGGIVGVQFAAAHPEKTAALVLVSTPGPAWHLKRRHRFYARAPWVFGPLFLAEAPWRLRDELSLAFPDWSARLRFGLSQLRTLCAAPVSLGRMGDRARLISTLDLTAECARIAAPTLLVTGEPGRDYVVPTTGSSDYIRAIFGARHAVIARTGHLGAVTRPEAFAELVAEFVRGSTFLDSRGAPPPRAGAASHSLALEPRLSRSGCD